LLGHSGASSFSSSLTSLTPCLPRFAAFAFFMCFLMWFAIPPLMGTIQKPKCLDPMGDICTECFIKFPDALGDAMAKDKSCKVCSPFADGIGMGCGGIGLSSDDASTTTIVSVAFTIVIRVICGPVADGLGVRLTYTAMLVVSTLSILLSSSICLLCRPPK
jgi:nitrate/nitrite transporter NarK